MAFRRAHKDKWPGVYVYESQKKKGDKCYYIVYNIPDPDSKTGWKKKREKIGWKSEGYSPQVAAEIRDKRIKLIQHAEDELEVIEELSKSRTRRQQERKKRNQTIQQIGEKYFETRRDTLKGFKTDYGRFQKFIVPLLGEKIASRLTELDVQRLISDMQKQGKAKGTILNTVELIRRFVNFGIKHGYCKHLAFKIKVPKKELPQPECLQPHELKRFLDVLDEWPSQDVARMLKVALFTGMRRGEIFKLRDKDLDFMQELIYIRSPKGGKDVTIPMNQTVKQILLEQLEWRDEKFPGSEYVFPGKSGGQRVDCSAVDRIKAKARLPKDFRPFHGLRHHFAVSLANQGYPMEVIADLLTHKDPKLTKEIYGQYFPQTKRAVSNAAVDIIMGQVEDDADKDVRPKVVNMDEFRE